MPPYLDFQQEKVCSQIPAWRQISATFMPASCRFKMRVICSGEYLFGFAIFKFYRMSVYGKLALSVLTARGKGHWPSTISTTPRRRPGRDYNTSSACY